MTVSEPGELREEDAGREQAEQTASRLAHEAIDAGDPTGWFEPLYSAAADGRTVVPWDRRAPSPLLVEWAAQRGVRGSAGQRALVVGCGLGDDAEFVAGLGFATLAFDISPSAIRAARQRFGDSVVEYRTADLMATPPDWRLGYQLVVESMTLQALPESVRGRAIACLSPLVAPGGRLLVLCRGRADGAADSGPPWSLTRAEIDAVGGRELDRVRIEEVAGGTSAGWRWRAEFRRPLAGTGAAGEVRNPRARR